MHIFNTYSKAVRSISLATVAIFGFSFTGQAKETAKETASAAAIQTIYLIGRDSSGHSLVQSIPAATFQNNLTVVFSAVQDSLIPKLNTPQISEVLPGPLEMRTLAIGIGLTGLIGLGPIFHMSLTPKIRLVFSNSKAPVYPD